MKPYIVPDQAVDVLQNWIEQDAAACAVKELDKVIAFLMKLHNEDADEVLAHLRAIYFLKGELAKFIPEKGGEQ